MNFHVITLFPEAFSSYINESIISRAQKEGKIKIGFYNPRDFAEISETQKNKESPYRRVDDIPYGGGPGMVMQAGPVLEAVEKSIRSIKSKVQKIKIIFLSPAGRQFTTEYAKNTAKRYSDVIIICGRYEGIDARVKKILKAEEISIGPFVLTGGELPAMAIIDCMSRQIEGVLGNFNSLEESRVSSSEVYTRPEVLEWKGKKYRVPKVLLSGNHAQIETWKKSKRNG